MNATLEMAQPMVIGGRSPCRRHQNDSWLSFNPIATAGPEFLDPPNRVTTELRSIDPGPDLCGGEQPVPGLSSRTLAERIQTRKPRLPIAVADDLDQVVALVKDLSRRLTWFWRWGRVTSTVSTEPIGLMTI